MLEKTVEVDPFDITAPTPVKISKPNFNAGENAASLCPTCIHRAVCFKRRALLDSISLVHNKFGVGEVKAYAPFDFQVLVTECFDFVKDKKVE